MTIIRAHGSSVYSLDLNALQMGKQEATSKYSAATMLEAAAELEQEGCRDTLRDKIQKIYFEPKFLDEYKQILDDLDALADWPPTELCHALYVGGFRLPGDLACVTEGIERYGRDFFSIAIVLEEQYVEAEPQLRSKYLTLRESAPLNDFVIREVPPHLLRDSLDDVAVVFKDLGAAAEGLFYRYNTTTLQIYEARAPELRALKEFVGVHAKQVFMNLPSDLFVNHPEKILRVAQRLHKAGLSEALPAVISRMEDFHRTSIRLDGLGRSPNKSAYGDVSEDTFIKSLEEHWNYYSRVFAIFIADEKIDSLGTFLSDLEPDLLDEFPLVVHRVTSILGSRIGRTFSAIPREMFKEHPDILEALCREKMSGPREYFLEIPFRLILEYPDFSRSLLEVTDSQVFRYLSRELIDNEDQSIQFLAQEYGEHTWGIFAAFGENVFILEPLYVDTLQRLSGLLGSDFGRFLSCVPRHAWSSTGMRFAEVFEEAASRMYECCPRFFDLVSEDDECLTLNREIFGIRHFYRYGFQAEDEFLLSPSDDVALGSRRPLIQNIENLDPNVRSDLPLAVVCSPRSDHNGAFRSLKHWEELTTHKVFMFEVDHREQITEALEFVTSLHGNAQDGALKRKVDLFVIGAHSNWGGMFPGEEQSTTCSSSTLRHRTSERSLTLKDRRCFQHWSSLIAQDATVLLSGCSVARGGYGEENIFTAIADEIPHATFYGLRRPGRAILFKVNHLTGAFEVAPDVQPYKIAVAPSSVSSAQ